MRQGDEVKVYLPRELPALTPTTSRILLEILVELTEVEALDGPRDGGDGDC